MLAHLAAACPQRLTWLSGSVVLCHLGSTGFKTYSVEFDSKFRVIKINLNFHVGDEDLLHTFDEAIGPIVPLDIRDTLRQSIVVLPEEGRDSDHSPGPRSDYKRVMWFYLLPGIPDDDPEGNPAAARRQR